MPCWICYDGKNAERKSVMMRRIRHRKGGMNDLEKAQYFHDMAAEGKILEEAGYLYYFFREEEPQELYYQAVVFPEYPTEQELEGILAEGWEEVSHWEKEYIFVSERADLYRETGWLQAEKEKVEGELGQKEEKTPTLHIFSWMMTILLLTALFYLSGRGDEGIEALGRSACTAVLFAVAGMVFEFGWNCHLQKRRMQIEKVQEFGLGNDTEDELDWRRSRKRHSCLLVLLGILLIGLCYYAGNFNEKTFDMPKEYTYQALPAVDLRKVQEGDWERARASIDPKQEGFWLRMQTTNLKAGEYKDAKLRAEIQNYGISSAHLPTMREKVFTTQYYQDRQTGAECGIQTEYRAYRMESLAERAFRKKQARAESGSGIYSGAETDWTDAKRERLPLPEGSWDAVAAYRMISQTGKGERLHILLRQGEQLLEIKYKGEAPLERLLEEAEAVFAAQADLGEIDSVSLFSQKKGVLVQKRKSFRKISEKGVDAKKL